MPPKGQKTDQSPTVPSAVLTAKHIIVLTDAAMKAFDVLYDIERQQCIDTKTRLTAELARVDLFGLTVNQLAAKAEEYRPS